MFASSFGLCLDPDLWNDLAKGKDNDRETRVTGLAYSLCLSLRESLQKPVIQQRVKEKTGLLGANHSSLFIEEINCFVTRACDDCHW